MTPEEAIVAALESVAGLSPTTTPPASIVAGCAWPAWSRGVLRNGCVVDETFYVYVALPNGTQAVVTAGELRAQVAFALSSVGKVPAFEAWQIPVEAGGQAVPVIRYTVEV